MIQKWPIHLQKGLSKPQRVTLVEVMKSLPDCSTDSPVNLNCDVRRSLGHEPSRLTFTASRHLRRSDTVPYLITESKTKDGMTCEWINVALRIHEHPVDR